MHSIWAVRKSGPLPNAKILDVSKWKAFADDKISKTEKLSKEG